MAERGKKGRFSGLSLRDCLQKACQGDLEYPGADLVRLRVEYASDGSTGSYQVQPEISVPALKGARTPEGEPVRGAIPDIARLHEQISSIIADISKKDEYCALHLIFYSGTDWLGERTAWRVKATGQPAGQPAGQPEPTSKADMAKEIASLRATNAGLQQSTVKTLSHLLDHKEGEIKRLQARICQLDDKFDDERNNSFKLAMKLEASIDEVSRLKRHISRMEAELERAKVADGSVYSAIKKEERIDILMGAAIAAAPLIDKPEEAFKLFSLKLAEYSGEYMKDQKLIKTEEQGG